MSEEHNNGNGKVDVVDLMKQGALPGARLQNGELVRKDGLITEALDKQMGAKLGVIQRFITAVEKDEDYRQILKFVPWRSTQEQDKATNALACCRITGATEVTRIILDRLTARTAGLNGWLIREAMEGLTHTTFTSQEYNYKKDKNGNSSTSSPISNRPN